MIARSISGPFGQQRAKLHHQDDSLALFQTLDKSVLISLADDLAHVSRNQLGERNPQRTGHLGVIVRRCSKDLTHVQAQLLRLGMVDKFKSFLKTLQILMADKVLYIIEVK